ncbi:MAG: beta-lactamase family protein [Acidimicrobiia bacterium]|nr:beta-lactamase family protein [Acidimicrobiia bacterium]
MTDTTTSASTARDVDTGFTAAGISRVVDVLEAGIPDLHDGFQIYVSRHGVPVIDAAGGHARPDTPMTTDTLTLWFSSTKPLTAVAIGILWERGAIALDDLVRTYIPEFGAGKEAATIRHVLTHRGGFPFADFGQTGSWDELVERVMAAPANTPPGSAAMYHATAGWVVLGELVRRVDGRRIDQFVREEICEPLGMADTWLGIPAGRLDELRPKCAEIACKVPADDPARMIFDLPHLNTDAGLTWLSPGGCGRGPAHDLGKFYEMILGRGERHGVRIASPQTIEALTAVSRIGIPDMLITMTGEDPKWGVDIPWSLGFAPASQEFGPHASHRAVGHAGHASSIGYCDPEHGLAVVVVTNGLAGFERASQRMVALNTAIYSACGLADEAPTVVDPLGG